MPTSTANRRFAEFRFSRPEHSASPKISPVGQPGQRPEEPVIAALTLEYLRYEVQVGLTFAHLIEALPDEEQYARARARGSYEALRSMLPSSAAILAAHPELRQDAQRLQELLVKLGELSSLPRRAAR